MAVSVAPLVAFATVLLLLAAATVVRARPIERPRARWFALAAAGLAVVALLSAVPQVVDLPAWVTGVRLLAFVGSGLALVAFRDTFVPVPRRWAIAALLVALVAVVVVVSATAEPGARVPGLVTVPQGIAIAAWSLMVITTGVSFWRIGSRLRHTRRMRLHLLGAGLVLLGALPLVLVAVSQLTGGTTLGVTEVVSGLIVLGALSVAIAPTTRVRRWFVLSARSELGDRPAERIALAMGREEVAEIAAQVATDLVGGEAAFVAARGEILAAEGMPELTAQRILDWSGGASVERFVRIDEDEPVLLLLRPIEPDGCLGVVGGRFTPVFGGEDVARLDELAATVGLAFTRAQLFDDLLHAKARSDVLVSAVSDLGKGVLVSDGERFLEVNDAFCDLLGRSREELLAIETREELLALLIPVEERREMVERTDRIAADLTTGPVVQRFQTEVVRGDGRRLDVSVALRTVDTAEGPRLVGVVRDTSDEQHATRLMRRRAEQIVALQRVESAVAGILDRGQVLDVVASALTDVLEVRCGAVALLDAEDDGPQVRSTGLTVEERGAVVTALRDEATRRILDGDTPIDRDLLGLPAGHPFSDEDTVGARLRDGERTIGVVVVARSSRGVELDEADRRTLADLAAYLSDLLRVVRAYEREHSSAEELRDLDATRDLLVSAVSHDLREPLAAIAALAQTLETRGHALDATTREDFARRIRVKAERLMAVTADLLDVDRLRREPLSATSTPTPVRALVEHVVEALEPDERARVTVSAPDALAHVDGPRTERIIDNLVRNALRHSGDEPVWVTAEVDASGLQIVVEDGGAGVPFEERAGMFEPYRGGGSGRGFGLGLAIVERLCRAQGGQVRYAERSGGGARFIVTLPGGGPRTIDVTDHAAARTEP